MAPPSTAPPTVGRVDLAILTALLGAAFVLSFAVGGWAVDDSWIVLRYVRNILAGHGWVYNIGEPVNGSTSALNTMILAGLGWLTGGKLALAQHLTLALAVGGTAALWFVELRRWGRLPATVAAVIVLASPMPFATLGLESSLVLFFGSAAVLAFVRGFAVRAGLAYGLLFLARGDGVLLGLPLAIALWKRPGGLAAAWRPALQLFGTAALVATPWLSYSAVVFGSPMPQTFAAKLAQTSGGAWGDDTFFAWIPYYFTFLDWRDLGVGPWPFAALLLVGTCLAWRRRHEVPAVPIVIGWCALQCVAYSALQIPRYHWYFTQMLFATTLAVVMIFATVWGQPLRAGNSLGARHLAAVALTCAWLFVTTLDYARLPSTPYPTYQRAAKWLDEHAPPDASIAAMDIGILGYMVGERPIVDMCSLVHADGVADIAAGRTGWWYDKRHPDYIVVHRPARGIFEQPALDQANFAARYEFAADPCSGIRIYRRRSLSIGTPPR